MTTWYVRPDTSHSGTRNGTSYETAWGGWTAIVWGGAGVVAGDTLYVCGAHSAGAILGVGAHGATSSSRVTIRGDYAGDAGVITISAGAYYLNVNRSYTTVQNLTINAGSDSCIALGGAPLTGATIKDCTLNAGASEAAIEMFPFDTWSYVDITIEGNTFTGGGGTGGSAIEWYATTAVTTILNNLQIRNNTFTGCSSQRGVILLKALDNVAAGTKMADLVIADNTFTDCYAAAMEIYGPDVYGRNTGIRVTGNKIYNQQVVGTIGGGMAIGGFGPSLTSGFGSNVIARNEGYVLHGPTGLINVFYGTYQIFDNYAEDLTTDTIDGCGILFDHGCDNCVAYGNHFKRIKGNGADGYYSGGFGILILDATNITAYGNVVDGCVTGVAFGNKDAGQSANIFNNTFRNCSQAGAYLVGGAEITNNLVRNNIFTATRSINSVKNNAATWTGESSNCFYGFGAASGHTLHASNVYVDPELDANYRPCAALTRSGTYLGGKDFSGKHFYDPPNYGAVDDVTATPRYALRKY